MKPAAFIALAGAALVAVSPTFAQSSSKIWRCGNTYTNSAEEAKAKGCKPMDGGNITIIEGTRVNGNAGVRVANAPQAAGSQRVDSEEQKARDANARAILEAELKKAETRQAELAKEYNNGEPEKQGPEHKNYQKYLDRVAELKANIARNENDIAGLRRELGRLPAK
jgi:hypothetical protein